MANIADYLEEALLDHVFRNTPHTSPTTVYCGLIETGDFDADLEEGILTNEILAYTGDRKAITFGAPSQEGGKATIKNSAALEFENTVGNILYWCPLAVEKTCNAGDTFRIAVDGLVLDLA